MFEDRSNSRRILHLIPAPVSKGVLGMPEISRRARILQEHASSGVEILLRIFLYSILWVSAYFCWARYRNNKNKLSK